MSVVLPPSNPPPDGFKNACMLFKEIVDYSEYIEKYGCTFKGYFTCCPGNNNTMLETFARDQCNTTDVCGYEEEASRDELAWLACEIIAGMFMLGLLGLFLNHTIERKKEKREKQLLRGYDTFKV